MKFILTILLLLFYISFPAQANDSKKPNVTSWRSIPILYHGRIQPLDSFARVMLETFSGKQNIDGLSSADWLAEGIFDPASAMDRKIFQVREENSKPKHLSYLELAPYLKARNDIIQALLDSPSDQWSEAQAELMRLHENFILATQLFRALTGLIPLTTDPEGKNYFNLKNISDDLEKTIKKLIRKKGTDFSNYTDEEKKIAMQSFELSTMAQSSAHNLLFRVIKVNNTYQSPWQIIQDDSIETSQKNLLLSPWMAMMTAWQTQDQSAFDAAVKQITAPATRIEVIYNDFDFIHIALFLYALGLVFGLVYAFKNTPFWQGGARLLLMTGWISHAIHMGLRLVILERPPVGTLYESILFVALICIFASLVMFFKSRDHFAILMGNLCGVLLLVTGEAFAPIDRMAPLVAVLNTNFWLTTHVICITIGYAVCLLTALLAHLDLGLYASGRRLTFSYGRSIKILSLLSLFFVTVGTILGGLWADQSWGRFWGWDPKENGALLIILWLVWLIHAQFSRHLDDLFYRLGMAFLSVIVILAWFGVNLLSVGLHSYGFISGVAGGIAAFCLFELALLTLLWWGIAKKDPSR